MVCGAFLRGAPKTVKHLPRTRTNSIDPNNAV